jgi:hypothetical protein
MQAHQQRAAAHRARAPAPGARAPACCRPAALRRMRASPRLASPITSAAAADNQFGAQVCVVLGTQWGDEGKGKLVDILAQQYDVVCRAQVRFFFPTPPSVLVAARFSPRAVAAAWRARAVVSSTPLSNPRTTNSTPT